jgi:hypothetical protein
MVYDFGRFVSPYLNPSLIPVGFVRLYETAIHDLKHGMSGASGRPIVSRLVGHSPLKSAGFWTRRLDLLVVIFAFGYATVLSLNLLGFSLEAREIVAYSFGLGLLAVGIDTVRRALRPRIAVAGTDGETVVRSKTSAGLISAYFVLLWCLWAFGAVKLFWLAAIVVGLVWAIAVARRSITHLLQQPGAAGIDTTFGKQFFDISEAQREAKIEPDGVLDDLRWETIAGVGQRSHMLV